MEVTQEQLHEMVQLEVNAAIADKHPGNVPVELASFKKEITEFAKQITDDTPVRYDSMSQALNSIIRTKLKLKRINDLPISQIDVAHQIFEQLKAVF
ncbi:hypothetical protein [Lactiplantibacillus plantarum]|uniref:hypothetical protein n=1 Tax=Lactiplantibacillus plantarum TaxID=1590 RepID=UPI001BA47D8C|nr:hypothetical protein [Lactiplantibacillus plantarum]MBS0937558.1 hypothetical protein [Lactiplantibacillus plantarum]MBS0944144.1 hypothetical protein [Lactiplantibacillus plantarum]